MKKKLLATGTVLSIMLAALCSACGTAGQTEETEQESFFEAMEDMSFAPEFDIVYAETERYPELADFLADYYEIPEEYLAETRYYYNYVDLNGDGVNEIAAATIGDYTSESGGDAVLLLEVRGNEFCVIGKFEMVHTPVIISDEVTDGWRDVIFPVYGGGMDAGYIICHYTAGTETEKYFEEEGVFTEELEVTLTGTQVLSNNLIDDMDKGTYLTLTD